MPTTLSWIYLDKAPKDLNIILSFKSIPEQSTEITSQNSLITAEWEMKIKEAYQYRFIIVIFEKGEIPKRRRAFLELIF